MTSQQQFFLGFIPQGEVETYYEVLTKRLEKECGVPALSKRVRAHLTIVPPFYARSVGAVGESVRELLQLFGSFNLTVYGFGRFWDNPEDQTLYLDVMYDPQLELFADMLTARIGRLPDSRVAARVGGSFHPHVSVARHLSHEKAESVDRFVTRERSPRFEGVQLDALTLFRVEGSSYVAEKEFRLGGAQ
ncbi:2'-5' RNA ligase family protein [Candidatus Kaiserbacteria bacterium]|nr:2'-5' RNA ligase family protein [Candidatus Kaiserbacteria bacterium]